MTYLAIATGWAVSMGALALWNEQWVRKWEKADRDEQARQGEG
jgi:hypothetical protein